MHVSIGEASKYLGVAISTLRRWHRDGSFMPKFRTLGGHRRYALGDLEKKTGSRSCSSDQRKTILYARTSGHDQKQDLLRQINRLEEHAKSHSQVNPMLIKVRGSGLNYKAPGLKKLIRLIMMDDVERIILVSKDRLLRFGADIIFHICALKGIEIVILDQEMKESFEQELTFDLICILTVFTSKLYGKRSHKNRRNKVMHEAFPA